MSNIGGGRQPEPLDAWKRMEGMGHDRVVVDHGAPKSGEPPNSLFDRIRQPFDNRTAIRSLMTALHTNYPQRTAEIDVVLNKSMWAMAPLTSRLIEKAIHIGENDVAALLDRHDHPSDVFAMSTKKGLGLISDLNTLLRRQCDLIEPGENITLNSVRLAAQSIKEGIDSTPSVGSNIKSKVHSLVSTLIECTNIGENFSNSRLDQFDDIYETDLYSKAHMLFIDGDRLKSLFSDSGKIGRFLFDNERGYACGMLNGMKHMIETVHDPLDSDLLEVLHDTCIDGVHRKDRFDDDSEFTKGYRDCGVQFSLTPGRNCTQDGLDEFSRSSKQREDWIVVVRPSSADQSGGVLKALSKTPEQCRLKADEIVACYATEVKDAREVVDKEERENAILVAIARCCQDLDQHHLFSDGNIRTVGFLVMNKLLLQEGLDPVIHDNPNRIDMHSIAELVDHIKGGQKVFDAEFRTSS